MRNPPLRELLVEDVMTQEIIAVAATTSLAALLQLFLHHEITGAPVIEEDGRPIGVVTSSDLLDPERRTDKQGQPRYFRLWQGEVRAVGMSDEGPGPAQRPGGVVADIMTHSVLSIGRRATLRQAAQLMARADVHRLVVIDAGRTCGMVTAMDCLKGLTR